MSGGGGGALDAMNKSIKANRGLVKKISVFDKIKNYTTVGKNSKIQFTNKLSKEELDELRRKSILADRMHTFWQIFKLLLVLATIVVFITIIIDAS